MARPRSFDEERVVDQAMDLFWQRGYRDTTPRDLLDATGLSKSSLYATFGSKEGLFLRAIDRYTAGQELVMNQVLGPGTLREGLARLYAMMVPMISGPAGRCCLICSTSVEIEGLSDSIAQHVAAGRARMARLFEDRLRRAQSEGELPAERDVQALAGFIISSNMGLAVLARSGTPEPELRAIAAQIQAAVLR